MSDTDVDTSSDRLDTVEASDAPGQMTETNPTDVAPTGDSDAEQATSAGGPPGGSKEKSADTLLVREGDIAADYLERLLDIADYDGDIDLDVENDRAIVAVIGSDLRSLVGAHGETLDALQELTRLAVAQQTGARSRLMLDISGHRQERRTQLQTLAVDTAARVQDSGEPVRLTPMNPFERKVIHDAVAAIDGVVSESEGEEPHRRVVVLVAR